MATYKKGFKIKHRQVKAEALEKNQQLLMFLTLRRRFITNPTMG